MFELSLLEEIEQLIEAKKYSEIKKLLPLHPADIADLISQLARPAHKLFVFRLVSYDKAVDVFEYLSTDQEEEILKTLNSQEIQDILNEMSPDDRTELFEEMPAELAKRFINLLSPQERKIAIEILNYPSESVGRLVTPDFVQLYQDMTVAEALAHIRQVGIQKETVYHCYVLDNEKRLIGIVSLKKLVLSELTTMISEVMSKKDVIKVTAVTDREVAANIFKHHDLLVLPVVDNDNKLLGIVTFDDLVDVLEEEATEDFEKMAAVLPVEKPYLEANFFELIWKRSFWLIVLVVLESASSIVMKKYGGVIQHWVALSFYLPILIATGGNAGMQSAMMVIRGLTIGDISTKDFFKVIFRESLLGFSIGAILALVGLARVILQERGDWLLSVSVGVAMGVTVMFAAVTGATLPIIFRKLKLDPALMSGPLITTIVDVLGVFVYFEIALLILGL
ncbi:MAG: magnesium transporter [Candidatus Omnitrophica bacterium]|nr:magnesium transporter [Candidatus Omnitrophota bacterium]MBU2045080.1 magnesium transporter [Candidatus Omnitrophota bacterium]MBU2251754.1 magnesium transporter [Candidatus Omnitrophota bacterium]MBU2473183.1 magnesium transporter [Candidatus Omnitrophota bacterium]